MRHRTKIAIFFAVASATGLATSPADAGGFETARFGADHGQPALSNPYAVYYNPGALAGSFGTELQVDGTLAARVIDYTRSASSLTPSDPNSTNDPTYVRANSGAAHLFNVVGAPFVGFSTDFGTRSLHLGLATYLPFGGQAQWDQNGAFANSRAASAVDGPQRWSDITGKIIALYNTAAFAYRFDKPRIGIGVGLSLILHQVQDLRARNLDGSDDVLASDGSLTEGRALLDVSGIDLGASGGVYWEPLPSRKLRLGASYTSQPGFGQMRLSGQLTQQLGSIAQPATPVNVDLLQTYPDIVRLGGAWRVSDYVELRLDGAYERWSAFKNQCIVVPGATCSVTSTGADAAAGASGGGKIIQNLPRNWKDTFTGRAGAAFFLGDTEVFASGGFASGAPPKNTLDPALFDGNNVFGTFGARYAFTRHLHAALSYNYVYYLPIDTTNKSILENFAPPSRAPNAGGTYDSQIYFFNANVTYTF